MSSSELTHPLTLFFGQQVPAHPCLPGWVAAVQPQKRSAGFWEGFPKTLQTHPKHFGREANIVSKPRSSQAVNYLSKDHCNYSTSGFDASEALLLNG